MTDSPWQYFSNEELSCSCCGLQKMDSQFMSKIVILRRELGFPFNVSSAYRCPAHNAVVSGTGVSGPHTTGHAIDIDARGKQADLLLEAAYMSKMFTGKGIQQKGDNRFIHLDDLEEGLRPWIWSY